MTVSVIVPAYNAAATVARTIGALLRQNTPSPFEIIVVDDGSTDDTARVIQACEAVRYVFQENAGPAAARNHGARLGKGEYLCFTDSDCVPHADWISCLLKGFTARDIAVVCGSYSLANPESILARGIHGEIIFRHHHLMPDFPRSFGSYNFCIRKRVFDQVGGFQTAYRQASGEDNDLSYRVQKAKQVIYFERKALVAHTHTTGVVKYLREQFRHGFWRVKMYLAHSQMIGGDDYTFWKDIVEVPWSMACLLGIAASILGAVTFQAVVYLLWLPFFIFELIFAMRMGTEFFPAIFFGFVIFFRAFVRMIGLSTGVFYFLVRELGKKFK